MVRGKVVTDNDAWHSIPELGPRPNGQVGAAEEIADHIQQLIVSEQLGQGTRLPSERDLAQRFATSRPTVSQAIRVLVTRGLVESRRGSGAYVTRRPEASMATSVNLMLNLNQESVEQLNEFRLGLEIAGIQLATERRREPDLEEGARALHELSVTAGDTAAWVSADTRFHATLVRASLNPYLASVYESVHAALISYEYRAWIGTGTVPAWLRKSQAAKQTALHRPILDAVRNQDASAAQEAVLRHNEVMAAHLRESQDPQLAR